MPVPTAYDEATLGAYLAGVLGELADTLGWDGSSDPVAEAVTDALLAYGGVATCAAADDVRKLRALGRVAIWRQAVGSLAARSGFSADGARFDRQQQQEMALKALALAEAEAAPYGGGGGAGYAVGRDTVRYPDDPYLPIPDAERPR